ncbi:MAG: elongation factor G [Fusobacterium perfoetens]|uniref:elongation factor G n=1 Tax=Fusobacterium perfoetens TaxID=852 RepID=UPI0023EFDFEF|nr:elongation factor G [Fusobacterium perfoetens]MCI6152454.1 elongation factor G [Fusobacterium perfoetens]MDY3237053.1 elongation factor G [Fusobacterium perfoetens]
MKNYTTDQIRNVSFLGHRGSGKTSLVEALLYRAKVVAKPGIIEKGNTLSDYDEEEITRQFSINTSVISLDYQDKIYNILDTPGYADFRGEVLSALTVSEGAVIVIDASAGIEVGTEKAWRLLEERNIPRIIFINKMDKGAINYKKILTELKEKFGKKIAPFCIPLGEGEEFKGFINVVENKCRIFTGDLCEDRPLVEHEDFESVKNLLVEAVAETSEEAMEKFFNGEEFTHDEIQQGLRKGVVNGDVVPVVVGSAIGGIGFQTLFEMIYDYMPTPVESKGGEVIGINPDTKEEIIRKVDMQEPFSAFVFKTIVDPFIGKISLFKVNSGIATKDVEVLNASQNKKEKLSNLYFVRGIKQRDTERVVAGDIAATTKLPYARTGDTLCDKNSPIVYGQMKFPRPCIFMNVIPTKKSDDEKISTCLQKLAEEDPTLKVIRNSETKELLIGGQGKTHLEIVLSKLFNKFQVQATLSKPKVAYRETIRKEVSVQGKHKKQSGGAGQYGDVFIKFEPLYDKEYEFVDNIKGGVVPKQYLPAVEKGLHEAALKGPLAGYPVINFKATLFDGSYHPVDSNEISFKQAAILAFRKAMESGASPVLLEPIVKMEIIVPEEYTGDVMGDMNKRRGKILGIDPLTYGEQKISVEVPQKEVLEYAIDLKAMTQSKGRFEFEFLKYDYVPNEVADKVIEEARKDKEDK